MLSILVNSYITSLTSIPQRGCYLAMSDDLDVTVLDSGAVTTMVI